MRIAIAVGALLCLVSCSGWKAGRVRNTVLASTSCQSLRVLELPEGWRVDGCDGSWFCESPGGPCEPRACAEWEEAKYNKCIERASRSGGTFSADFARAYMAEPLIQECRTTYDRALQQCGVAVPRPPAEAPPPKTAAIR